jgi:hypothetical protein
MVVLVRVTMVVMVMSVGVVRVTVGVLHESIRLAGAWKHARIDRPAIRADHGRPKDFDERPTARAPQNSLDSWR